METNTELKNAVMETQSTSSLDATAKRLLSDKQVLARIMKNCLLEYSECEINDIIPLIEAPRTEVTVHMGEPFIEESIIGRNPESKSIVEGNITYDVVFDAQLPDGSEKIGLIINVEAQNNFNPGYSLIKRGLYYCSRLISQQKGHEFIKSDYDSIRKVYSIWVCISPLKEKRNTISRYSIEETCCVGCNKADKAEYDILSMVLICLPAPEEAVVQTDFLGFLGTLFNEDLSGTAKMNLLEEKYNMVPTKELKGELDAMCNYSEAVLERGIQKGIQKGATEVLRDWIRSLLSLGCSEPKIIEITKRDASLVKSIIAEVEAENK